VINPLKLFKTGCWKVWWDACYHSRACSQVVAGGDSLPLLNKVPHLDISSAKLSTTP